MRVGLSTLGCCTLGCCLAGGRLWLFGGEGERLKVGIALVEEGLVWAG